jgi:hypothetical protein
VQRPTFAEAAVVKLVQVVEFEIKLKKKSSVAVLVKSHFDRNCWMGLVE